MPCRVSGYLELTRPTPMTVPENPSCQSALKTLWALEFRECRGHRGNGRVDVGYLQRARVMLALDPLHFWLCHLRPVISPLCASASSSVNGDL